MKLQIKIIDRSDTKAMNCFDIMGPVMVGPSSSHTAGAVRIGRVARALAGQQPVRAVIRLHGSFAKTYRGHGTDRAILAGLLGFNPDDERIRISPRLCREAGLDYTLQQVALPGAHPNTAIIELECSDGRQTIVQGASTGGGRILIESINGLNVSFRGEYHTLVISHRDAPGVISRVTRQLAERHINIATMKVFRSFRGGTAVMIIETDEQINPAVCDNIKHLTGVSQAIWIEPVMF